MSIYWPEFFTLALVHLLAVISPGADFALILRQSLTYGRRVAILSSLGIALGLLCHLTATFWGMGLLIQQTPWLFHLITLLGAGYLVYLAWQSLLAAQAPSTTRNQVISEKNITASDTPALFIPSEKDYTQAIVAGFLTNLLNPKALLFFLALFSTIIRAETSFFTLVFYGAWMSLVTFLWFALISIGLGSTGARAIYFRYQYLLSTLMALMLIFLAIKLAFSSI